MHGGCWEGDEEMRGLGEWGGQGRGGLEGGGGGWVEEEEREEEEELGRREK